MVVVVVVDFGSFSERQAGLPNELLIGHMSFVNRFVPQMLTEIVSCQMQFCIK